MSALFRLMQHRQLAGVHRPGAAPRTARRGITNVWQRDADPVGPHDPSPDHTRDDPAAGPRWWRWVLPVAIVLSAVFQLVVLGSMFGWWK